MRAQQDEADERGTYSPEMHEKFVAAGFYRITQPRMFGGYEFDLGTFYRVMLEIARGHPGVGWCLALAASHAFEVASHWSEQAQIELFGDGHFIAPHRAPPLGTLTPVAGGYRLSGQWDYCSGIPYATHFIGGALIRRPGEAPVHGHAVVPQGSYTILDDWGGDKVLGMRASGSNSVRVEDVFVPEHHVGYLAPGLAVDAGEHGERHARHAAARQSDVSRPARRAVPRHAGDAGGRRGARRARRIRGDHPHPQDAVDAADPALRARRFPALVRPGADADRCGRSADVQGLRHVRGILRALGRDRPADHARKRTCGCGA